MYISQALNVKLLCYTLSREKTRLNYILASTCCIAALKIKLYNAACYYCYKYIIILQQFYQASKYLDPAKIGASVLNLS